MLKKEDVYLRLLSRDDLERTYSWMNEPEIMATMSRHQFIEKEEQKKWFDGQVIDNSKFIFAICLIIDDTHIGNISLSEIDYINRNGRYAVFIGDKQYRGKGYGRSATEIILDYAFDYLNLHKIYLKTSVTNEGAIKMYEKMGFVEEGILREHEYLAGEYVDKILFSYFKNSRLK